MQFFLPGENADKDPFPPSFSLSHPLPCITRRLAFSLSSSSSPGPPPVLLWEFKFRYAVVRENSMCEVAIFTAFSEFAAPLLFFPPSLGSGHKNRAGRIERRRWRPVKIVRFCATLYIFRPTLRHRMRTTFAFIIRTDIHPHSLKNFRAPF